MDSYLMEIEGDKKSSECLEVDFLTALSIICADDVLSFGKAV